MSMEDVIITVYCFVDESGNVPEFFYTPPKLLKYTVLEARSDLPLDLYGQIQILSG